MRRTFKIKFYCRDSRTRKDGTAPVEVSVIVDGEREIFSLPRSCAPKDFPTDDLKIYCHSVENKLNGIYTALTVADEPVSAFILKDIYLNGARKVSYTLKAMFDDGLMLKREQDPSVGTYKKYEMVRNLFYSHTGYSPSREAGSVTHADIRAFYAAMDAAYKPQTVSKIMMRLKYFFLLAFNSGRIRANPFAAVKIRKPSAENVYLTAEELDAVRGCTITDDKIDRVRDLFVFLCGTGLEYADLAALSAEDVKREGTLYYIRKPRVKTGVEYVTVMQPCAVEVWNFYGGKLPLLSNQKFNTYLKEVGKIANISSKKITTLTARHTFATSMLNQGLSLSVVSRMLGHQTEAETKTYAKMLAKTVLVANAGLMEQKGVITPPKPLTPAYGAENGSDLEAFEAFLSKL
jgi:site-specific recombinase XerD